MKKDDNITQLYKDAFSDFSVSAPESVYKKVQIDLGRMSLLTWDPTRLNVFYLALMSGLVALAILGVYPNETAEVNVTPNIISNTASVLPDDPIQENELIATIQPSKELEKAEVVQSVLTEKAVNRMAITNITPEINLPIELVDELEEILIVEEFEFVEELENSLETIKDKTIAEETEVDVREKISLSNSRVEPANEFMRLLSLDSDKKGALTISTKKK
ncbi:MAG TPA: hypothetical protein DHU89_09185 [Flavobacteriales bacterium]|mgnify:CR=1 FL=1|nr:hypothetical protein [Flavobacteriales bacterium]|tara:strand:+ start:12997 stop:13653 length:657 start_codon:yes stop_codon:yes gene_type:complete